MWRGRAGSMAPGRGRPSGGEREFFIRKSIGWVLREISRRDPAWVASWTRQHAREMSGVTFREAVRRLPPDEAEQLRADRTRTPDARATRPPPLPVKRPAAQTCVSAT